MRYIYGFHAIEEAIKSADKRSVLYVSSTSKRVRQLEMSARSQKLPIRVIDTEEMNRMSGNADHRGALLATSVTVGRRDLTLEQYLEEETATTATILLLDGITDPHNLGAILRSADQFSVEMVVVPAKRSARESDVVHKVSSGAAAFVPTCTVTNLSRALTQIQKAGFWVYGAEMKGTSICDTDLTGKVCLVMGSEGKGISRLVREHCDHLVSIPTRGHVDSLNVSVATGVILYEISRQNRLERST